MLLTTFNIYKAYEYFDFPTVEESGCQPGTERKEYERERKICRLVTIKCGLRLRRVGDGYVK